MKDKRFWFGTSISLIWLCGVSAIVFHRRADFFHLKLNELGDLFAGSVAPLAFLWLVLGFLQQGEELQLNTKALELQSEELSKSVEHQKQMVEIARTQLDNELESARAERNAQRESAKPKFVYTGGGGMFTMGLCNYDIGFRNVGNTATQLSLFIDTPSNVIGPCEFHSVSRGETCNTRIQFGAPPINPIPLSITYFDALGFPGESHFILTRDLNDDHSVFSAKPTEPNLPLNSDPIAAR
ncbi:MAG TPA: hypothetical protein VGK03_12855 [Geothrix sp.]|jgi:hypothetical protein